MKTGFAKNTEIFSCKAAPFFGAANGDTNA